MGLGVAALGLSQIPEARLLAFADSLSEEKQIEMMSGDPAVAYATFAQMLKEYLPNALLIAEMSKGADSLFSKIARDEAWSGGSYIPVPFGVKK
jgi:hypothetical protein